ncbi:isoprenylcysteine carboxylmethyltransferase family protein [Anabaena sphaerica FACHB-251]|uniref:methanethiol S-methyltransferase n=1 Tax=Anabaena sphaerica FACHB-251 TaxID=2692883 RepID=A0A926WH01_9NOST|nr:methanethiol S-methyltransferase [Anabaena sphaerica]MBD2293950.1 isoprenylcysteine carboxylmethyltransferase family protein [Anabaena sphaerica FACHB-251]
MNKIIAFAYGLICYLIFFATFLYLIGFIGNFIVPKSLDSALQSNLTQALIIDLGLILLFGIQHSGMARPGFKQWWTKTIPTVIERSTYVLSASLMLLLLFWQWQPLGGIIWQIQNPIFTYIIYGFSALGWLLVLASTFLINHFDLFGLRQVYLYLQGQEYKHLEFKTVGIYKYVRHPLMLGFLIAFWSTPTMTITHFIFALGMTIYILIAIQLEERDLIEIYGSLYEEYRQQVSMLIPFKKVGINANTTTSE